jgi:ubiquinone/menaquinone biosynthesis C-methylase UbiE
MSYSPFPNQEYRNLLHTHAEIPAIVKLLRVPSGCRILEVGCGRGVALTRLAPLCTPSRLVGLDISPELIAHARARLERSGIAAELVVSDVRALPFVDGAFDVVIDFGTCYHIDDAANALCEIARVLAPGGVFVHESRVAQLIAHPRRTSGRSLPWQASLDLIPHRSAMLWASRRKVRSHTETHVEATR